MLNMSCDSRGVGRHRLMLVHKHTNLCLASHQLVSHVLSFVMQDQEKFDLLPEADDDENDMLDLAFALTDT